MLLLILNLFSSHSSISSSCAVLSSSYSCSSSQSFFSCRFQLFFSFPFVFLFFIFHVFFLLLIRFLFFTFVFFFLFVLSSTWLWFDRYLLRLKSLKTHDTSRVNIQQALVCCEKLKPLNNFYAQVGSFFFLLFGCGLPNFQEHILLGGEWKKVT
jgi:hypothetical protein